MGALNLFQPTHPFTASRWVGGILKEINPRCIVVKLKIVSFAADQGMVWDRGSVEMCFIGPRARVDVFIRQ